MVEEKHEGLVNRLGGDHMVIIENECKGIVHLGQIVDQAGQESLERWRLGSLKHAKRRLCQIWLQCPECRNEVRKKANRIIIIIFEREPGDRIVAPGIRSPPL